MSDLKKVSAKTEVEVPQLDEMPAHCRYTLESQCLCVFAMSRAGDQAEGLREGYFDEAFLRAKTAFRISSDFGEDF